MTPAVIAISGYSGAGKTTLIASLVPALRGRGLAVGVLKHDAHGLDFDRPGKDTHRLREAGAARVEAFDSSWWFQVAPAPREPGRLFLPAGFRDDLDILVVEGGKGADLDKLWFTHPGLPDPPVAVTRVLEVVERGDHALDEVLALVVAWLDDRWARTPQGRVVLVDERCAARVSIDNRWHDLPAVPLVSWPLAGVLAAMRWSPDRAWLVAHDSPAGEELAERLLGLRRPGVWAVLSEKGAVLEPQALHLLERGALGGEVDVRAALGSHPKTLVVKGRK